MAKARKEIKRPKLKKNQKKYYKRLNENNEIIKKLLATS